MPPISSDALVLRTFKLGETSKIVVLLTRERGKLRAVAKGARGARPRYQSSLEPLSQVRVSLYGRQGTELYRLGECELVRSAFHAGEHGLDAALAMSYFAELLDAFAQEGEAEDAVYRLALAVLAAVDGGTNTDVLGRYLEAWLLKLHGIYPPLDRCSGCDGPLAAGERRYHRPAHGFVCEACGPASGPVLESLDHDFLREAFARAPTAVTRHPSPAGLESFQRELIRTHLERDLHSHRVLRDVAREMRG
ncbi:MAG TPA: DNA repair protein RecO [Vicinamibacteria bacterium]|jgi:DNA repair protein RecO (recombination protein O)|nr:DNA repair protein RecO [Vicinamibacteria bacterium]